MPQKQILLIEDDRLVAKSLASLLTRSDIKVMIASSGDLACQLCQTHNFDLIISDICMPGELGTQVIKRINKERAQPIPCIFITGYSEENYIREAEEMGCRDFLHKPFDSAALLAALQKVFSDPFSLNDPFKAEDSPIIQGAQPPSRMKRFFYSALGSQWNPEKEIEWNGAIGLDESQQLAMGLILSPIIMGEFSAFNGIPKRILSFGNYEIKQYLSVQLVDETRHAEAFELYLTRINGVAAYKKGMRNIHVLRFFNRMKKLTDVDQWVTGLFITEILAHVLLSLFREQAPCPLTQHLFKMILADEARHISFGNFYLKSIFANAAESDRQYIHQVVEDALKLTEGMIHSYNEGYRVFSLNPGVVMDHIRREIRTRVEQNIVKGGECPSPQPS